MKSIVAILVEFGLFFVGKLLGIEFPSALVGAIYTSIAVIGGACIASFK